MTFEERQESHYKRITAFCEMHGYKLLTNKEDIINVQSKIKYICNKHGIHETRVCCILAGKLCYKCSRENAKVKQAITRRKGNIDDIYDRVLEQCHKNGYTLITPKECIGTNIYETYVEYMCPMHGNQKIRIGNLLSGKRCPKCNFDNASKRYRFSKDEVIANVSRYGGEIINPDDYVNNTKRNLDIKCPRCGKVFKTSLRLFTQHGGQVCDNCSRKESNGERAVRLYLEKHNIDFIQGKWFEDCRDVKPLPFDFYLPTDNKMIEFDGEQHFREKHFFVYDFEKNQRHDEIKNQYCEKNNINLIRIPYWNIYKINDILDEFLAS